MSEEHDNVCEVCCGWVVDHRGKSPFAVMDGYPEMMRYVLKHWFGMPGKVSVSFIEDACWGNWLKLHETDMERCATAEDYAKALLDDVFYCSDRWSWDRVMRVQWLYRRLHDRCERKVRE